MATSTLKEVYDRVRELSADERFELTQMLLDEEDIAPNDWWESIAPEVARRLAAIESGEARTVPWDEVRQRIRDRLDGKRDSVL